MMEEIPNQEQNEAPQPAGVPDAAAQEVELAAPENADVASEKSAASAAGSKKSKKSEKSKNSKMEDGSAIPQNKKDGDLQDNDVVSQASEEEGYEVSKCTLRFAWWFEYVEIIFLLITILLVCSPRGGGMTTSGLPADPAKGGGGGLGNDPLKNPGGGGEEALRRHQEREGVKAADLREQQGRLDTLNEELAPLEANEGDFKEKVARLAGDAAGVQLSDTSDVPDRVGENLEVEEAGALQVRALEHYRGKLAALRAKRQQIVDLEEAMDPNQPTEFVARVRRRLPEEKKDDGKGNAGGNNDPAAAKPSMQIIPANYFLTAGQKEATRQMTEAPFKSLSSGLFFFVRS